MECLDHASVVTESTDSIITIDRGNSYEYYIELQVTLPSDIAYHFVGYMCMGLQVNGHFGIIIQYQKDYYSIPSVSTSSTKIV